MNMSFINRASPHEVLSFFTQPIYPSAKDWLTMDAVQSAIMTSSLINLPLAEREPYLQFSPHTHRHVHTHTHETAVSAISRHFFFFLFPGIMGKFLATGNGSDQWRYWSVVNTLVQSEQWLLDGSPWHLVQTIVIQRGLSRGCIV